MPNFDWLLQSVEDKMDVSQDFTDSPRMNVFAKFDEIPSMILEVIKETKRYGHTDGRTTWKQYTLPQTQFAGGIIKSFLIRHTKSSYLYVCWKSISIF